MALLAAVMLITVIAVSASGDNGVLKGPLVIGTFGIYFVMQLVCLLIMKPSLSIYKAGFYLLHIGMLILLIGFLLFEIFGISLYANVPVNSTGNVYPAITKEDGTTQELGFGIRLNNFKVESYESGAPKYYGAYLGVYDYKEDGSGAMYNSENIVLEVNNTYRKNGWKIYLMSYDDGSARLPDSEVFAEYSSVGGASAVIAQMTNSQKYENATVYYFVYDASSAAYTSVGSDPTKLAGLGGNCRATVYQGSNGAYYAYLSQTHVQLLFKKDPGEFVTVSGMVAVMLGALAMCVLGQIKLPSETKAVKDGEEKAEKGNKTKKRGGGK